MTVGDRDEPGRSGAAYGDSVAERLRSPAGAGRLETPDAVGEAGSTACGALVRMELALAQDILQDVRYQAYGCPATLACAAEVADRVEGRSLLAAAAISEKEICDGLGLKASDGASADLALEALHAALTNAVSSRVVAAAETTVDGRGVLVGMSGGVDSTVAALLLQRDGYRVVGATLRLWADPNVNEEGSCCSPETVRRARRAAHALGIPHLTVDASEAFCSQVVEYFIDEHRLGRTPNPCAKCNARVRFGLMTDLAHALGLSRIATGHYARLTGSPPILTRGIDRAKDQSYVLAEVGPEILRHAVFPLGTMSKTEVRALAAEAALEGHAAPESQEICFVPDDDHRRFLRERLGELPGTIVDADGRVMGRHLGTYNFTVGQRKGLGIAAPDPLYVVGVNAARGEVLVGAASESAVGGLTLENVTWHRRKAESPTGVKLRSAGDPVLARVCTRSSPSHSRAAGSEVVVVLEKPAQGVAPGQTAVVYDGEAVLMAGTICSTTPWVHREASRAEKAR